MKKNISNLFVLLLFILPFLSCNSKKTDSVNGNFREKIAEKIKSEIKVFNDEVDVKNIAVGFSGDLLVVNTVPLKGKLNSNNQMILGYVLFDFPGQDTMELLTGGKLEKGLYQAAFANDTVKKTMNVTFTRGTQIITVPVNLEQVARQPGGGSCFTNVIGPDCNTSTIASIHVDTQEGCIEVDWENPCKCMLNTRLCLKSLRPRGTR